MPVRPDAIITTSLVPRMVSEELLRRFEGYATEIFEAFGMDMNTPATADKPRRFVRALYDATDGYDGDPKLVTVFETECRGGPDCRDGSAPYFETPVRHPPSHRSGPQATTSIRVCGASLRSPDACRA